MNSLSIQLDVIPFPLLVTSWLVIEEAIQMPMQISLLLNSNLDGDKIVSFAPLICSVHRSIIDQAVL